jgi:hypothetical protein
MTDLEILGGLCVFGGLACIVGLWWPRTGFAVLGGVFAFFATALQRGWLT